MTHPSSKIHQKYSAKLSALALLSKLGWSFLSQEQAVAARGGKLDEVVLRNELRSQLRKRRFIFAGKQRALSNKAINRVIAEVCSPGLNEGLTAANEKMYNKLLYGISVNEYIEGKKANPTVALIDWHNSTNNRFSFTETFTITCTDGIERRRPDIVCFVNGIPLAVIEAKCPDDHHHQGPTIDAGIALTLRNQHHNDIPLLFVYSQLLLVINGSDGRYGTCGTPTKFWAKWREEDISETQILAYKNKKLTKTQISALLSHLPAEQWDRSQALIAARDLAVNDQDTVLIGLLQPARLLEMTRFFTIFDKKAGKIVARYPQVFGAKRLLERITVKRPDGRREGGVIWHTTASGNSFTMAFLSRALILHDPLKQCRILVVSDRRDLKDQRSNTMASGSELSDNKGRTAAISTSGTRLAEQIGKGTQRIIFSLSQKFHSAVKLPQCHNPSGDIIVLIEESPHSHEGVNTLRMQQSLPNAAFVIFTGTPLVKEQKTNHKFGPIVHAYTIQRAAEDEAVAPLLYEERSPDFEGNEQAIDRWFDRITDGLSDDQRKDLKRKFSTESMACSADDRIQLIAMDVANHFSNNIIDGLRGQLVCDSKSLALKYKEHLDNTGLFESAVIISAPASREGNTEVDESTVPEVTQWWNANVGPQDERVYTKQVIDRFCSEEESCESGLKMLIVVDKLLTEFDEPKNTVLYIDKALKGRHLIQATTRVNRLHPRKDFGLLIDYRGILTELDTTLEEHQDSHTRTQGGFDIDDIAGMYKPMSTEYEHLPQLYTDLWGIFRDVKNQADIEQLRQVLIPKIEDWNGQFADTHLQVRNTFYKALNAFARGLKVALQSATFLDDTRFSDEDRRRYKEALKGFSELRKIAKRDAGEMMEYDNYVEGVQKLLDKHMAGINVREAPGIYDQGKTGGGLQLQRESDEKTRNETDLIKTRVTKMIEHDLQDDPYAQEAFSSLWRKAIKEAEALIDYPLKQYMLFNEFEQQVKERKLNDIPAAFAGNQRAQAYFGALKKALPQVFAISDAQVVDKWVKTAFLIDQTVERSVANNSMHTQNIETDIRKQLLPMIFKECKAIGGGMSQAKAIVEQIAQIASAGLNHR